jgi:hypothetical protein
MDRSTVAKRLSRTPPAPFTLFAKVLHVDGLGRHGPDHASRGDLVVGPPRTTAFGGGARYGYAFGEPPRVRGRGAPVTVHCTVAACPHSPTTCQGP